jgi:methylglyoxal synthase
MISMIAATIALIAHDVKKEELADLVRAYPYRTIIN